jgi:hypothetical protein
MKELSEFIPSPRAAKRFINIYRLLRASVEEGDRAAFDGNQQGGVYQAAMLLLAILTCYPAQATEIFRTLIEENPQEHWWEFIASFKGRILPDPTSSADPENGAAARGGRTNAAGTTPVDKRLWIELFEKLGRLEKQLNDRPCQQFNRWASRVARYSFQSGRVLLSQPD